MTNWEQYVTEVPLEVVFMYFFSHGCEDCPAQEYCYSQPIGTCCHDNFMSWANAKIGRSK